MKLRTAIGNALRRTADRIDPSNVALGTGLSFTMEPGEGLRLRRDGRGCRLWYLGGDAEYDRAYAHADADWSRAAPTISALFLDPDLISKKRGTT